MECHSLYSFFFISFSFLEFEFVYVWKNHRCKFTYWHLQQPQVLHRETCACYLNNNKSFPKLEKRDYLSTTSHHRINITSEQWRFLHDRWWWNFHTRFFTKKCRWNSSKTIFIRADPSVFIDKWNDARKSCGPDGWMSKEWRRGGNHVENCLMGVKTRGQNYCYLTLWRP